MSEWSGYSKGSKAGILGAIFGVLASLVLLFVPLGRYSEESLGRGTTTGWGPIGLEYLLGNADVDPALFFWAVIVLGGALVGGYGAISENRILVWIVVVVFVGITVLGLLSIGVFIAPSALLFLLAGFWLRTANESEPR